MSSAPPPATLILVDHRGRPTHQVDLVRCERAWRVLQVQRPGREYDTQRRLATLAGTSSSTVTRFWRGKPVTLGSARRIIATLDVRFEDVTTVFDDAPEAAAV